MSARYELCTLVQKLNLAHQPSLLSTLLKSRPWLPLRELFRLKISNKMSMFTQKNYRHSYLIKNNKVMEIRNRYLRAQTFLANAVTLRVDRGSIISLLRKAVVVLDKKEPIAYKNTWVLQRTRYLTTILRYLKALIVTFSAMINEAVESPTISINPITWMENKTLWQFRPRQVVLVANTTMKPFIEAKRRRGNVKTTRILMTFQKALA